MIPHIILRIIQQLNKLQGNSTKLFETLSIFEQKYDSI